MTTPLKPSEVPADLVDTARDAWHGYPTAGSGGWAADVKIRMVLAAVLPEHERQVRAQVADELREDADAHRRLVARKPSEHDAARLARASTLDDAASRIARGDQ